MILPINGNQTPFIIVTFSAVIRTLITHHHSTVMFTNRFHGNRGLPFDLLDLTTENWTFDDVWLIGGDTFSGLKM